MNRIITRCESCAVAGREVAAATTHSVNPDFSGYNLCAECAAEYDGRPLMSMPAEEEAWE